MSPPRIITIALVASLGIHLALILLIPEVRIRLPVSSERWVEVEVARPVEPPPPEEIAAPPEPPPEPEPPAEEVPEAPPVPPPLAPDRLAALDRVMSPLPPVSAPPAATLPRVELPRRERSEREADALAWSPPPPAAPSLPIAANPAPPLEVPPGPDRRNGEALARSLLSQLELETSEPGPQDLEALRPLDIEGPVGREREVLRQPSLPQVPIRHAADVRIRFYVSPRGDVVDAVPVERAGGELDRIALEYVKQFVFNPLPHGADQGPQWGTIRVRFRLQQ